jgi:hypothetical protein
MGKFSKKAYAREDTSNVSDEVIKKISHRVWDIKNDAGKLSISRKIQEATIGGCQSGGQNPYKPAVGDIVVMVMGGERHTARVASISGDEVTVRSGHGDVRIPTSWCKLIKTGTDPYATPPAPSASSAPTAPNAPKPAPPSPSYEGDYSDSPMPAGVGQYKTAPSQSYQANFIGKMLGDSGSAYFNVSSGGQPQIICVMKSGDGFAVTKLKQTLVKSDNLGSFKSLDDLVAKLGIKDDISVYG